jgi:hypothetical protein
MAFQFNPQAYDRGAAIVGGYYAKERQDELDRQAAIDWQNKQVDFANRQTVFDQGQEDRSRLEGAYDQYGKIAPTTDAYGGQVEGFTRGLSMPTQRPVEPATAVDNPAMNNVISQPGTGLPVGNFAGDPRMVLAALNGIKDPVERERAKAAYHLQLNNPEHNAQLLQEERARLSGQTTPIAQGVAPARQPVPTSGQMEPQPAQGQGVTPPQAESPKQTDPVLAQLLQVRQALLNGPRSAQGLSKLMEVDTAINGRSLMNAAAEVGKRVSTINDPQQRAAVVDNLFNKTMGLDAQTTPDGYAVLRIADKTVSISPQNMAYAAMGAFMMQHDPDKGFAMLTKADKELADYVKANNLVMTQHAGNVNQVQNYRNQDANNDARTSAYTQSLATKAPRELSPETVARLNTLSQQIAEEQDPAKRRALENQWQRENALAATELGKVVQPRQGRVEVDPKAMTDLAKYFIESGQKDPDEPLKPLTPQKALDMARAQLSGQPYVTDLEKIAQAAAANRTKAAGVEKTNETPPAAPPAARGIKYDPVDLWNWVTTPRGGPIYYHDDNRSIYGRQ